MAIHGTSALQTQSFEDSVNVEERARTGGAYLLMVSSPDPSCIDAAVLAGPTGAVVVGRNGGDPKVTRTIADSRMSKPHFSLSFDGASWLVEDLASRNGTFLAGRRLPPRRPAELSDGQTLRAGDTLFVFRVGLVPPERQSRWLPGRAPALVDARELLEKVSRHDVPVLLLGPTGTGKEFAARLLHEWGAEGAFVPVNCGELSKTLSRAELFGAERGAYTDSKERRPGLVDAAQGGTLFLDEIGDLAYEVQVELVRFLENRTYRPVGGTELRTSNARVVAATNADLETAVAEGRFRRDLLARLKAAVRPVLLPALSERPEDIVAWADYFLVEAQGVLPAKRLDAGAAECLLLHPWPDNLRGLRGAVRSACLAAGEAAVVESSHLERQVARSRVAARNAELMLSPPQGVPKVAPPTQVDRDTLIAALVEHGGVIRQAASALGVERRRFYRLCQSFGILPDDYRGGNSTRE